MSEQITLSDLRPGGTLFALDDNKEVYSQRIRGVYIVTDQATIPLYEVGRHVFTSSKQAAEHAASERARFIIQRKRSKKIIAEREGSQ